MTTETPVPEGTDSSRSGFLIALLVGALLFLTVVVVYGIVASGDTTKDEMPPSEVSPAEGEDGSDEAPPSEVTPAEGEDGA